jgi:hypothetical protein
MPDEWTLDWPRYRFFVEAEGFLPVVREVDAATPVDLGTLTLDPGETLAGRLAFPDGTPVAEADLRVSFAVGRDLPPARQWDGEAASPSPTFRRTVRTDGSGRFRLAGLPRGAVRVSTEPDPRFLELDLRLDLPTAPEAEPIRVRTGTILTVRALDGDGHPAPRCGVVVRDRDASGEDDLAAYGSTDVEGTWMVRLAPGSHRLQVQAREGYATEGDPRLDVVLEDGVPCTLTVEVPGR